MKKFFRTIALSTIALAVIAGNAMAYQITLDVSGERTQSRNATQGTTKAAYYNPSGLVNLPEGIHVDLGNRILNLVTTVENTAGQEAISNTWTLMLPNAAAVWRVGAGALFLTFDIREGGAGGSWIDDLEAVNVLNGTVGNTNITGAEGTTYTYGISFGGAARLNNMLAFTGGVRLLQQNKYNYYEGNFVNFGAIAEYKNTSAYGWQGFLGFMVTPMEGLNITFNYVSETLKTGETASRFRNGSTTYASYTSWSPNMIALGVGYTVAPGVEIQLSYNLTLEGSMSYGGVYKYDRDNGPASVFGLGAEYKLMDLLSVSFGLSYHDDRTHEVRNNDPTDPSMDKVVLGAGVVITPMPGLSIDLGMSYHMYLESTYTTGGVDVFTYNRNAFVMGFAVSYGI